jgi:pimeloyl-ACP methyl ester carboxylesterase
LATFVLIHGAGSDSWYWHLLAPELRVGGHDVVAMDLPCDDNSAGLSDYADTVVGAIGDRTDLVVVAQSLAGFTAPLVCARVDAELLVLLNAMVPATGESAGEWWANTGWSGKTPETEQDFMEVFFHDVPPEVTAEALQGRQRAQSGTPFEEPWPLDAWPDVATKVLIGRQDRFFPLEFQRSVARERLGIAPDEMDGGHLVALSQPQQLADRLQRYAS